MTQNPSASEIILAMASTGPGGLIFTGFGLGVLVFLVPLFLPETHGWRDVEKRIVMFDWGISIASALIGLGFLLLELNGYGGGFGYSLRARFALSGFFFAIAGQRIYSRATQ